MAEYDKTLELFKKLQEGGVTDATATPIRQRPRTDMMTGDVASLNEAVFGRYNAENDNSASDGSKILMETMKEYESGNVSEETRKRVEENVKNSKIPKAILESVLAKPLIETKINGSDVNDYMENLMKKNTNIEASKRINQKLNESDASRQPVQTPQFTQSNFDYTKLQGMIEEAIDKKLNQFIGKMNLSENRQAGVSPITQVQEINNTKFLFADSSNNVYECTLKYIGKNKKTKE